MTVCSLVITRYHEVGFGRKLVEMKSTSLAKLSKPSCPEPSKPFQNIPRLLETFFSVNMKKVESAFVSVKVIFWTLVEQIESTIFNLKTHWYEVNTQEPDPEVWNRPIRSKNRVLLHMLIWLGHKTHTNGAVQKYHRLWTRERYQIDSFLLFWYPVCRAPIELQKCILQPWWNCNFLLCVVSLKMHPRYVVAPHGPTSKHKLYTQDVSVFPDLLLICALTFLLEIIANSMIKH